MTPSPWSHDYKKKSRSGGTTSSTKGQYPFSLRNNTFFGAEGPALDYRGTNTSIINNDFLHNDWSAR